MISEPAVGSAFFGRKEVLDTLGKRVNALKAGYRQNVALTGQMLSGKSSILYQFLYTLKDTSLIPVYVEVVEESFSSFADKFVATLLYSYLKSEARDTERDLPNLIKRAESLIPHTVYAVKKLQGKIARKKYTEAYKNLLDLTSILKKETGKSCVVILDEFHNLEFHKIKKPYLHFGKFMMIQKDTMYIVSSSQINAIKRILSEKLALLYGNFEVIEISGFDGKTAENFLQEKLQSLDIPQNHIDYLIDFTDGNPFYLDVISKKIIEIANFRKLTQADEGLITEAFTSLIYTTSGTINQYFTNNIMNLIERALRKEYLDILAALALGFNKLKDIAGWFNKKSTSELSKKLEHLIELDMVIKNGIFYEVRDRVFKFWLRTVYHEKKMSLVDDIVNRANDFVKEVEIDANEYLRQSKKSSLERLEGLFLLFNGEMVEIERKKRRLPKFVKIESRKYGKCDGFLAYQTADRYWVCEIFRNTVDEAAISDLIERSRPMREKVTKKVCMALGGIDTNALLLAKEKNVWVWDIDSTNALLRLYKKRNLVYR
ncbi:MAG: ATP-binding protein [Omnitrophica bacterium]|nr:ATP-binding protein [Candidatus Omnitrophota bacterium]